MFGKTTSSQTQIPLGPGPNMIGWVAPGQDIPGASSSPTALKPYATTYPLVTHVLDKNDPLKKPEGRWPKLIVYRVTPNYTYSSNPQYWPQFLKDNYQEAEKLVLAEQAKPLASQNAQALNYEIAAMKILFNHAHELFPATFTCDAEYYIASYDPSNPWHCSHDNGTYDAEV